MKTIITLAIAFICCSTFAQQTNLSQMTEKARNEYLTKLAKEVTENIGPGWLQGEVSVTISPLKVFDGDGDTREHIKALLGRKYYEVTFIYDEKTKKEVGWSHASEVRIWEDSGEPIDVIYGHNYGRHFLDKPYKEFVKEGIGPTDQVKFEKMYIPEWMKFRLMTEEERKEYLIKKAKEVALAFAPEWMQWEVTPQVSPKQKYFSNNQRQDIQKNVGREYYAVTFYYNDETKAKIKYDYAATVRIWADSGEVASIGAGDWVKAFLDTPCELMMKEGIKPEDQMHFEPIDGKLALSQMTEEARNEYLLKKSKEVVLNFGPEWYQEPMTTTIRGPVAYHAMDSRSQKYNGRQCYFVSYYYDKYKDTGFSRAFTVCIWEEDGEPEGILYGNEHGQAFFGSYNKMVKDGVKKEQQMSFWKGYYDHYKDINTDY
jgi:hypothetical protein